MRMVYVKMVDGKNISISALITLGLISASIIIPGFFDEPKYYCETRPELNFVTCDEFSKYVSPNGKCFNHDSPNFICRSGWLNVTNDLNISSNNILYEDNIGRQEFICGQTCEILE